MISPSVFKLLDEVLEELQGLIAQFKAVRRNFTPSENVKITMAKAHELASGKIAKKPQISAKDTETEDDQRGIGVGIH